MTAILSWHFLMSSLQDGLPRLAVELPSPSTLPTISRPQRRSRRGGEEYVKQASSRYLDIGCRNIRDYGWRKQQQRRGWIKVSIFVINECVCFCESGEAGSVREWLSCRSQPSVVQSQKKIPKKRTFEADVRVRTLSRWWE